MSTLPPHDAPAVFWIDAAGEQQGPESLATVVERIAHQQIPASTPVWYQGAVNWAPFDSVPELSAVLHARLAPPAPAPFAAPVEPATAFGAPATAETSPVAADTFAPAGQPVFSDPVTFEPAFDAAPVQPVAAEPAVAEPTFDATPAQPVFAEPQPVFAEPAQPVFAEPQPVFAEPAVAEPALAEPVLAAPSEPASIVAEAPLVIDDQPSAPVELDATPLDTTPFDTTPFGGAPVEPVAGDAYEMHASGESTTVLAPAVTETTPVVDLPQVIVPATPAPSLDLGDAAALEATWSRLSERSQAYEAELNRAAQLDQTLADAVRSALGSLGFVIEDEPSSDDYHTFRLSEPGGASASLAVQRVAPAVDVASAVERPVACFVDRAGRAAVALFLGDYLTADASIDAASFTADLAAVVHAAGSLG